MTESSQTETWEPLLERALEVAREGRFRDVLQLCDRAAVQGEQARYHAALIRGRALLALGDAAGALSSFESVADPMTPDAEVDLARGLALFELLRLPEAEGALRSAVRNDPNLAEAYHTLGLLAELQGTGEEVALFRIARKLGGDRFAAPAAMPVADFEDAVHGAINRLPQAVLDAVGRVHVTMRDCPDVRHLHQEKAPQSPRSLGVRGEDVEGHPSFVLFKRNLERAYKDAADLTDGLTGMFASELSSYGPMLRVVE